MPKDIQAHITRVENLLTRLISLSQKLFQQNGFKNTTDTLALYDMSGKLIPLLRDLKTQNQAVDIETENIKKGFQQNDARTERAKQTLQQYLKRVLRVEKEANALIADIKQTPIKKEEKPAPKKKPAKKEEPKTPTVKKIQSLTVRRTALVDKLIASLEKKVGGGQDALLKMVVEDLIEKLDKDGDIIKNTIRNKRLIGSLDSIFNKFNQTHGLELVKNVAEGVRSIIDFNGEYFGLFETPATLQPIQSQVKESIGAWLGITERGALQKNGYLDTILKDSKIRNKVRDMTMGGIVSQKGFFEVKKGLGEFITDSKNKTGSLKQYYRNFVYDTFSVADRTAAKITADKLKFNYAVYEGGLIKTSRKFCKDRNGKVFSREEVSKFNPKVAKQPGYNAFTDLGGYGCRHHLNWVPDLVAFLLRPDLKPKGNID